MYLDCTVRARARAVVRGSPYKPQPKEGVMADARLSAEAANERDSGLGLAELVGAFSLSTDLGLGQPMEHVLRSWVIAARLGDHVGLAADERGALFYVATLAWVGFVADTPELAEWFGDDIAFRRDSRQIDLA